MKLEAGLARYTTAGAISSGSAARCCGASPIQRSANSGRSTGDMSVRTYPGATALTRTPKGAHSAASDLVSWCTAALEALYAGCHCGRLTISPDIDPMLTTAPDLRSTMDRP